MPRPPSSPRTALALVCAFAAPAGCVVDEADHGGAALARDDDDDHDHDDHDHESSDAVPALAERREQARACTGYCEAFVRTCDGAYTDEGECLATCDRWALGEPGALGPSVACHAAMLPGTSDAFGSCIAAGPDSPICADA